MFLVLIAPGKAFFIQKKKVAFLLYLQQNNYVVDTHKKHFTEALLSTRIFMEK